MALREFEMDRKYSYEDYLQFPEGERYELIDGIIQNMAPAPSPKHQDLVGQFYRKFSDYLEGKTCHVYIAPFDVRLLAESAQDNDVYNVVQPDLSVVCDLSKLDSQGCKGSPDLIIEVLSPATAKKDRTDKMRLYQQARVSEYWIADPFNETVEVRILEGSRYQEAGVYSKEDTVTIRLFEDLTLDLSTIFRS